MTKPILLQRNTFLYVGLILLAAGLPLSKFLVSISQFVLLGSFFFEGNIREKITRLKENKIVWVVAGIWLMHVIGLIYTQNLANGIKDVRIKLPLFILPVIVAASGTIPNKIIDLIFKIFIASVLIGSLISTAVLFGITDKPLTDIRDIFILGVSHIRFGLFICLAIFYLAWKLLEPSFKIASIHKLIYVLLICWFVYFLLLSEAISGLGILMALTTPFLLMMAYRQLSKFRKTILFSAAIIFPLIIAGVLFSFFKELNRTHEVTIDPNMKTSLGNSYQFYPHKVQRENGYLVNIYLCEKELRESWNSRSAFSFDSLDKKSQHLSQTLIRYLTSLGWKKDAEAVYKMSPKDVRAVENGFANVNYTELSSFKSRLMELNWELQQAMNHQNPSGHSLSMRFEFWKTGWLIWQQNFWTGIGTGDLQDAFDKKYEEQKSPLLKQWRHRSHNQYLSIAIAFGCIGLIYFLIALAYPFFYKKNYKNVLYAMFLGITLLSMFTEDTLETQAGATFFAFFNALFLFSFNSNEDQA